MARASEQNAATRTVQSGGGTPATSQGLDWLWRHLQDVRQPRILDCGPISPASLQVLLRRGVKFYAADLVTPLLEGGSRFWDRSKKSPVFLTSEFLNQISDVPPSSLSSVLAWNLPDLTPHESLPAVLERLFSLLEPLGVLFCILREPYISSGPERRWWLESLTVARGQAGDKKAFPYPPITNREIERFLPDASIKIFLTRSGHREVLAMRPA
jgi:hypothetical protein